MKLYYLFFLILVSAGSPAVVPLEGDVRIFEYQGSQIVRFTVVGQTAKVIYEEMRVEPVYEECTGHYYKIAGDFDCFVLDSEQDYHCTFGVDLTNNALMRSTLCD